MKAFYPRKNIYVNVEKIEQDWKGIYLRISWKNKTSTIYSWVKLSELRGLY